MSSCSDSIVPDVQNGVLSISITCCNVSVVAKVEKILINAVPRTVNKKNHWQSK